MIKNKYILIALITIMSACQCPTDIDTPRIIEPDNSANVIFINATNKGDLDIYSSDILIYPKLKYTENSYPYKKAQAGVDLLMVKINVTDKNIINIPLDLKKNAFYTIIFYNISSIINFMLLQDNYTLNSSKTLLRLINSSVLYPDIQFKVESNDTNFTNSINTLTNTAFLEQPAGDYKISILEPVTNKVLTKIDNYQFKQNKAYSIILRTSSNIPDLLIVEHNKI